MLVHPSTLPITDLVTGNLFLQLKAKLLLAENAHLDLGMGSDKILHSSPEGKQQRASKRPSEALCTC